MLKMHNIFKIILFLDLNNSFFPDHLPLCWWFSRVVFLAESVSFYVWTIVRHKPKTVEMQPCFTFVSRTTNPWRVVIIIQLWSMFHLTNAAMVRTFFTRWLFIQFIDRNLIALELPAIVQDRWPFLYCWFSHHYHSCRSFSPQLQTFECNN